MALNKKRGSKVRRSIEEWKGLLKEYEISGKGVVEFCSDNKISRANFYQWKERIMKESELVGNGSFIPITLALSEEGISKEVRGFAKEKIETGLEIRSKKGISIWFEEGCGTKDLKLVLEVLNAVE
jgi:hypothetical protein